MADIDILFRLRPARKAQIGAIVIDAVVQELHEIRSTVTEHPIESGSAIADHIFNEPDALTLDGEITNSPVALFGGFVGLSERRLEAFEQLKAIRDDRRLVDIVTGLTVYTDMALVSLTVPRDASTGKRLLFTAEFRKVVTVATRTVAIEASNVSDAKKDIAQSTQDTGTQANRPATGAEASVFRELFF